jgi:competence protein ComEA
MPSVSISRSTALVGVVAVLAALVLVGHRLAATGAATAPDTIAPLEPAVPDPGPVAARSVVVHVVGAVHRPGLYRLREGARVADAVSRAGGGTRRAYLGGINLAAALVDGTQVLVPLRAPAPTGASGVGTVPAALGGLQGIEPGVGQKVSLSTATAEQLDALPGVGPVTAQQILDYRAEHGAIASVDELDAVPGIGPARLEQLRELVTP